MRPAPLLRGKKKCAPLTILGQGRKLGRVVCLIEAEVLALVVPPLALSEVPLYSIITPRDYERRARGNVPTAACSVRFRGMIIVVLTLTASVCLLSFARVPSYYCFGKGRSDFMMTT